MLACLGRECHDHNLPPYLCHQIELYNHELVDQMQVLYQLTFTLI